MAAERDLQKEVSELQAELKRLKERVDRKAWGNPHDFAYQALHSIELIHGYYASGVGSTERIRDIVEMLRGTAAGRVGQPYAGAAFIYGLADLIEGVYLGNRYNEEVHAYANRRRIEEAQRANREKSEPGA